MLAAQLVKNGKRPYLDFLFPQTALNVYVVAAWMRVFGDSWRAIHALASILTATAVFLTAGFLLRKLPVEGWRLPAAITAALVTGFNVMVFEYGTIGQAYGFCLLSIVVAYRFAVLTPDRPGAIWPALAGCGAAAAAASSLLTAPVAPVLLVWIVLQNRAGNRWLKAGAFVAGAILPLLPLLVLFVWVPRQVRFDIFDYNFFYRQMDWEGATQHNLEIYFSWINSSQALLLGLLALAGLLFIARSRWEQSVRSAFYLCGWLALALILHISTARPTFERYYLFTVPFLAILAAAGLYGLTSRFFETARAWPSVAVLVILVSLGLAKALYDRRENMKWSDLELLANKVEQVTAGQDELFGEEFMYFLLKRQPPSGMECEDSHKLVSLAPDVAASLHVLPWPALQQQVSSGKFHTVETCYDDDEKIEALKLHERYSKSAEVSGCSVYWDWTSGKDGHKNLSRMGQR